MSEPTPSPLSRLDWRDLLLVCCVAWMVCCVPATVEQADAGPTCGECFSLHGENDGRCLMQPAGPTDMVAGYHNCGECVHLFGQAKCYLAPILPPGGLP